VNHLMGDEGPGSMISVLKKAGWIASGYPFNGAWLQGCFTFFTANFELTDSGLEHIREIGEIFFAWLALIRQTPVSRQVWEEMKKIKEIKFLFQDDKDPMGLTATLAKNLQLIDEPAEVVAGPHVMYDYDPAAIATLIQSLTIDTVRVELVSKTLEARCSNKEPQYGTPYEVSPIQADWLEPWTAAYSATSPEEAVAGAAAARLFMPPPNPFIPDDLSVLAPLVGDHKFPVKLEAATSGADIFHKQDDRFEQPKARMEFKIYTPYLDFADEGGLAAELAMANVKAAIWCQVVEEALNEFAYPAQVAGLGYAVHVGTQCISLVVSGFNDKLGVLVEHVGRQMRAMADVSQEIYEMVLDSKRDDYKNSYLKARPINQVVNNMHTLMGWPRSTPLQRWEAMQQVTIDDVKGLDSTLLEGCHVEVLALGNLDAAAAINITNRLLEAAAISPVAECPAQTARSFSPGCTIWTADSVDKEDPNNAVGVWLQLPYTLEDLCLLQLLESILSQKFFDVLRTQQQLGYIVGMNAYQTRHTMMYVRCYIQSEFIPGHVDGAIDAFLAEHFEWVQTSLGEEELAQCLAGLISKLSERPKNLNQEFSRYKTHFDDRTYGFEARTKMLAFLGKGVTMEVIRKFAEKVEAAPRFCHQVIHTGDTPHKMPEEGLGRTCDASKWSHQLCGTVEHVTEHFSATLDKL